MDGVFCTLQRCRAYSARAAGWHVKENGGHPTTRAAGLIDGMLKKLAAPPRDWLLPRDLEIHLGSVVWRQPFQDAFFFVFRYFDLFSKQCSVLGLIPDYIKGKAPGIDVIIIIVIGDIPTLKPTIPKYKVVADRSAKKFIGNSLPFSNFHSVVFINLCPSDASGIFSRSSNKTYSIDYQKIKCKNIGKTSC